MADFAAAWLVADAVPGWLTREQAAELWRATASLDAGAVVVEIGSHQGRSTAVIAAAAAERDVRVVAVDPFVDGRLFGGKATRDRFEATLARAGITDRVRLIARPSTELRPEWDEPIGLLFIDGKHDYWTTADDLRWAEHLPARGTVLMHDTFSSIGVTLAVLRHVLPSRSLRYVGGTGSLARFDVGPASLHDRLRIVGQLPWFARNVAVKILNRLLRVAGIRRTDPF